MNPNPAASAPGSTRLRWLALALVAIEVLAALALAWHLVPVEIPLAGLSRTLAHLGWLGPLLYAGGYALAVAAFVPASLLTIGAGLLFGTAWGFAAASLGSTAGACIAFLIARHAGRTRVELWTRDHPELARIDAALGENGWRLVALTRLSPVFPFSALNYAYGVTRVRFGEYALASWLAMAPGSLLYTLLGSLGRDSAVGLAGAEVETYRLVLNVLGLGATAGVAWIATRMARRAVATMTSADATQASRALAERPRARLRP